MGNASAHAEAGLLFIDFEHPHRLRVQGRAQVSAENALFAEWPGADLLVRVQTHELWQNRSRYLHKYERVAPSR